MDWRTGAMGPVILFLAALGSLGWALHLNQRIQRLQDEAIEKNRQKESAIAMLDRVGESLTRDLDLEPALETIADYMIEATDAEAGAVYLLDRARQQLVGRVVRGLFPPLHVTHDYVLTKRKYLLERVKADRIQVGEGVIGQAAQAAEPLLISDFQSDPRAPKAASEVLTLRGLIAAPMRTRERVVGVLSVVNKRRGQTFTDSDRSLMQALSDQAAVAVDLVALADEVAEKQRLEQELRVAKDFQRMMLPKSWRQPPGFTLAGYCHPAREVGGDFFDFIPLEDGKVGFVIADASGKGIPGSLIMATTRSALRSEARGCDSPSEVLQRVNQQIMEDTRENVFVTMVYGILDPATSTIRFSRAGHEPLVVFGADGAGDGLSQHTPQGMALGMVGPELFDLLEEQELQLKSGDTAILYTDGVIEAMNSSSEEYGRDRFHQSLNEHAGAVGDGLLKDLIADVEDFTQAIPQHDDITLISITATEAEAEEEGRPFEIQEDEQNAVVNAGSKAPAQG